MTRAKEFQWTCVYCSGPIPKGKRSQARFCSARCRRDNFAANPANRIPCAVCGKPTSQTPGQSGARPGMRCSGCVKTWTREAIIAAIRSFAAEFGEPPATPDWNPTQARILHNEARAGRAEERAGEWPHAWTVRREFGSWAAGLRAAGFTPRAPHGGAGNSSRRRSVRAAAISVKQESPL